MSDIHHSSGHRFGGVVRVGLGILAAILIPPFALLAFAPMLLAVLPVALIAIPFVLSAFATQAPLVVAERVRNVAVLQPVNGLGA